VSANVFVFVFVGIVWPILFELIFWGWAQDRLWTQWGIQPITVQWITSGMIVVSPFAAAEATLGTLLYHYGSSRAPFWCLAFTWTVLAWLLAGLTIWATLETFDRYMGRIPEGKMKSRATRNSEMA
jgi:hypothetical protein